MLECSLDFCKAPDEMPQVLTVKLKKYGQVDGGLSGLKKMGKSGQNAEGICEVLETKVTAKLTGRDFVISNASLSDQLLLNTGL